MIVGIVIGVVVLFLLVVFGLSVKIVREYQRIVLFRLGRAIGTQRPRTRHHQPRDRQDLVGRSSRAVS